MISRKHIFDDIMLGRSFYSIFIFILFVISIIYYCVIFNENASMYFGEYIILIICNIFMFLTLFCIVRKSTFYIFEPIVFVWFLYYAIFVYKPIVNLINNNIYEFGYNTIKGCIKGTIVFMVSFLFMLMGYYSKKIIYTKVKKTFENSEIEEVLEYEKWKIFYIIFWMIGIFSFLIFNIMAGRNPIYMLSFGTMNLGLGHVSSTAFSIVSVFIYLAFYPMLNIIFYDKSLLLKFFIIYITCMPIATRGFRNVLAVCLSAPIVYYYTKDKREPSIKIVIIFFISFLLMFGFLGFARSSLRTGKGIVTKDYKYSSGLDNASYYFDSYKVYYGAIINYPEHYNYTMGKQLIYTFTMYIPRFLWHGKPGAPIVDAIRNATSDISASSGSAWPNIGEYYSDLGITGTIVIMFCLGLLLSKMKLMYDAPERKLRYVMLYSLYLPALVTIIAYGYTAGNTPQYVIMAFPLIIQNYFEKKNIKL